MEGETKREDMPSGDEKYPIKTVCSYCRKELASTGFSSQEGMESHGICPDCLAKELSKMPGFEKSEEERLD